ncbi:MAG: hypothetical protein ABJR07_08745, partial [Lentilitoribacter sp.]
STLGIKPSLGMMRSMDVLWYPLLRARVKASIGSKGITGLALRFDALDSEARFGGGGCSKFIWCYLAIRMGCP